MRKTVLISTPQETHLVAASLAPCIQPPALVYLQGPLGAGKTTFVQGFLREMGYQESVKSPTFTLVETYDVGNISIAHFDLYRLKSVDELEAIGFRDYLEADTICFIEWPDKAAGYLPPPTILCTLKQGLGDNTRELTIESSLKQTDDMHEWFNKR